MKFKTNTLLAAFFWCWFTGVIVLSIGFGALFPSINLIAKPFVCPDGKMELDKDVYNPYPGNTVTTITWYCMDEASGTQTELGVFPMSLYAGTMYGVLLFVVVVPGMVLTGNKNPGSLQDQRPRLSKATLARLRELQELREANLISDMEFKGNAPRF